MSRENIRIQCIVGKSPMADKVTGDNIYKALIYFKDFCDKINDSECHKRTTL